MIAVASDVAAWEDSAKTLSEAVVNQLDGHDVCGASAMHDHTRAYGDLYSGNLSSESHIVAGAQSEWQPLLIEHDESPQLRRRWSADTLIPIC